MASFDSQVAICERCGLRFERRGKPYRTQKQRELNMAWGAFFLIGSIVGGACLVYAFWTKGLHFFIDTFCLMLLHAFTSVLGFFLLIVIGGLLIGVTTWVFWWGYRIRKEGQLVILGERFITVFKKPKDQRDVDWSSILEIRYERKKSIHNPQSHTFVVSEEPPIRLQRLALYGYSDFPELLEEVRKQARARQIAFSSRGN